MKPRKLDRPRCKHKFQRTVSVKGTDGKYIPVRKMVNCGALLDLTGRCCLCSGVDVDARRAYRAAGGKIRDWTWHRLCNVDVWGMGEEVTP